MAIIEQCNNCGRSLSDCPYYDKDSVGLCQNYVKPIDNSRFFSNFFSPKGRIGRVQYLVTVLIAVAFYLLLSFVLGLIVGMIFGQDDFYILLVSIISFIPAAALVIVAGLKRCHDAGVDWWYSIIPILLMFASGLFLLVIGAAAFFFLFFQKSEEGLNECGTEPLKPYSAQVDWVEDKATSPHR